MGFPSTPMRTHPRFGKIKESPTMDALIEIDQNFSTPKAEINWIARHLRGADPAKIMDEGPLSQQWWTGLLEKNARVQNYRLATWSRRRIHTPARISKHTTSASTRWLTLSDITEWERCEAYKESIDADLLTTTMERTDWIQAETLKAKQDLVVSIHRMRTAVAEIRARSHDDQLPDITQHSTSQQGSNHTDDSESANGQERPNSQAEVY
ncbi:hypothetical protein H4Q26_014093 [Puccinia striiformis f. sp. tritici PST-130]|nr:hypothetical protein H4Q26_014093 [Puccinia striiformis f. sp. tritici PST-130]